MLIVVNANPGCAHIVGTENASHAADLRTGEQRNIGLARRRHTETDGVGGGNVG
jgi:hypothetical protein